MPAGAAPDRISSRSAICSDSVIWGIVRTAPAGTPAAASRASQVLASAVAKVWSSSSRNAAALIDIYESGPADLMSLRSYVESPYEEFGGGNHILPGGYVQVVKAVVLDKFQYFIKRLLYLLKFQVIRLVSSLEALWSIVG